MPKFRLWLFRGTVIAAAAMMAASFAMPWWSLSDIYTLQGVQPEGFSIYGYGLPQGQSNPQWETYWRADITPFYQIVLAWVYVAISAALLLYSTWLRGAAGKWLQIGIGLTYTGYSLVAVFVVIAGRLAEWKPRPIPLQGVGVARGEWSEVFFTTSLQPGFYLAVATGVLILLLGVFRNRIIGKTNPGSGPE